MLGVRTHTGNPKPGRAKSGGSWIQGQMGLQSKTGTRNKKQTNTTKQKTLIKYGIVGLFCLVFMSKLLGESWVLLVSSVIYNTLLIFHNVHPEFMIMRLGCMWGKKDLSMNCSNGLEIRLLLISYWLTNPLFSKKVGWTRKTQEHINSWRVSTVAAFKEIGAHQHTEGSVPRTLPEPSLPCVPPHPTYHFWKRRNKLVSEVQKTGKRRLLCKCWEWCLILRGGD